MAVLIQRGRMQPEAFLAPSTTFIVTLWDKLQMQHTLPVRLSGGGQCLQQGAAEEPPPIRRPPLSCGLEEIKEESKEVLQSSTILPESRGWPDSSDVDGFRTKPRISGSQHEKHVFIT